jgi:hypothetical protein
MSETSSIGETRLKDFIYLLRVFVGLGLTTEGTEVLKWYMKSEKKPRTRTTLTFVGGVRVPLTVIKNTFLIGHFNSADFSMISDFHEEVMKSVSIVKKSFVTLAKPLKFERSFVYLRDTSLLLPGGKQSLKSVGELYQSEGDFSKIDISQYDLEHMGDFLKRDPEAFKRYALRDSLITLKHSTSMEEFNFSTKRLGIPVTLSSIGRKYVGCE